MGFLDTLGKAKAYEELEKNTALKNAEIANKVKIGENLRANEERDALFKKVFTDGAQLGLAASYNMPFKQGQSFGNTPVKQPLSNLDQLLLNIKGR